MCWVLGCDLRGPDRLVPNLQVRYQLVWRANAGYAGNAGNAGNAQYLPSGIKALEVPRVLLHTPAVGRSRKIKQIPVHGCPWVAYAGRCQTGLGDF